MISTRVGSKAPVLKNGTNSSVYKANRYHKNNTINIYVLQAKLLFQCTLHHEPPIAAQWRLIHDYIRENSRIIGSVLLGSLQMEMDLYRKVVVIL